MDATFSAEEKAGASGVILRNSQGMFMAGSSTFIPHVSSVAMAEALAMLHGLKLALSLGCNNIEAESDNTEVIHLCSGENHIWNEATMVYANIISTTSSIGKVEFMHCVGEMQILRLMR